MSRGFTLLETVIFAGLLAFIIGAIVVSLQYTYRGQRFAFEQADATRSARSAIDHIVKDLREASYADTGAYTVESMATSSIVFFSDYNNDGFVERIRYTLNGTNIERGILAAENTPPEYIEEHEAVSVLSDNVRNESTGTPLFTFFDLEGGALTDYTDIDALGFVIVRVVVNVDPEKAPEDYELRSSAALRNVH